MKLEEAISILIITFCKSVSQQTQQDNYDMHNKKVLSSSVKAPPRLRPCTLSCQERHVLLNISGDDCAGGNQGG